jgi:hypothetical protein
MLNFSRLYKEDPLKKRNFTEAQRHALAEKGYAMPGCESAPNRDPLPDTAEGIELACKIGV